LPTLEMALSIGSNGDKLLMTIDQWGVTTEKCEKSDSYATLIIRH
jgi:hypothetical protein